MFPCDKHNQLTTAEKNTEEGKSIGNNSQKGEKAMN